MQKIERLNVYEKTQERLETVFTHFDNVYVSFSGGKDSSVLLNLCIDFIREHNLNRKLGVFHIDYEAQYECTTKYVDDVIGDNGDNADVLEIYRICVPFKVPTCTSMFQHYWRPWQPDLRDIWVSEMPKECLQTADFQFFNEKMWDSDFLKHFGLWLHRKKQAQRTCCLVGIRTQESLHRWRAIYSNRNYRKYEDLNWTKQMYKGVFNAYPIFDWLTNDIWTAYARFGWSYNSIYDLYYKAGVPLDRMRVASPFLSAAQNSLKLYKIIEPHTWSRLVERVNGVNFTSIYGGTAAMGWQTVKCPKGYTWKSYMDFLLSTLPERTRQNYLSKLKVSIRFWREKGGVLSDEAIAELRSAGVAIKVGKKSLYKSKKKPVKMEYLDDIDIPHGKDVPTYKRVCICIMKNDHSCRYLGFAPTKNEMPRKRI